VRRIGQKRAKWVLFAVKMQEIFRK
jgi:hypothetical protein